MSNLTNWKTLYKQESYGFSKPSRNLGVEIRVATDTPTTPVIERAMWKIAEQIEDVIMRETLALDPDAKKNREEERTKLLECFGDDKIFVEEIPNGYGSSWQYSQCPWFRVITSKGLITLGWRKRVIAIDWAESVGGYADEIFPGEDVTKMGRSIHAWGYDKAKEYISRLLAS